MYNSECLMYVMLMYTQWNHILHQGRLSEQIRVQQGLKEIDGVGVLEELMINISKSLPYDISSDPCECDLEDDHEDDSPPTPCLCDFEPGYTLFQFRHVIIPLLEELKTFRGLTPETLIVMTEIQVEFNENPDELEVPPYTKIDEIFPEPRTLDRLVNHLKTLYGFLW
jgi:hypothetical protein